MPTVRKYAPGTPSWVDLGTPDVDAAAAFYGTLFGWEVNDLGPDAGGYRLAVLGGRTVAGLGPATDPGPPRWSQYVSVDDIDATATAVTAAGGTLLLEPMDVMTAGKMCVFADPTGAVCSAWQPLDHIGAEVVNEPGSFSWSELTTRRVEESKEFYGAVFGWTAAPVDTGGPEYFGWNLGERMIGGMMPMVGDMWPAELPNHWMIYFAVDGTDAACESATAAGGSVHVPPTDILPGRFAVLTDPQGAVFSVITLASPGDDPNAG